MGFKNRLENAYYELTAPEKQELIIDSKKLDENIDNNSILQESISKLINKIKQSTTGKQRDILNKQLEELKEINKLFQKYKKIKVTQNTNKELITLFKGISSQISSEKEQIEDDYEKIKKILEEENSRLEDTIDIISYGTIRDLVEDNINIIGEYESITPQKFQQFFDLLTIKYIDFLENKKGKKLSKKEENEILNIKGFYLNYKEASTLINNFIKETGNKYKNLKFYIYLKKDNINKKVIVDLNQFINIKKKKEKSDKTNYDKLSISEKMKIIENILNNEKNKKLLLTVINKLENKTISVEHKKIKLTADFINKNKENLLNNLKQLILMIIHIESNGDYRIINIEGSSAKGLGQWLDGNGKYSTEYMYKRKWYKKKQIEKIIGKKRINNLRKRNVRHTSSFETTLKGIYNGYPDKLLNDLTLKVPKKYNKAINLSPIDLNLEQQIQLLILDIGINGKTVKNGLGQTVGIKDFMGTALLGNAWAIKEIYKIFHHTKPDKKTLNRIEEISPQYTKKLKKLY